MANADFNLVANVSLLFTELPLLRRFEAAANAGFQSTELWWPFEGPVPQSRKLNSFLDAIETSGIPLSGMNFWAGDMANGERGVFSQPARGQDLHANLEVMTDIARATGCRVFNALYGQRTVDDAPQNQDRAAIENLSAAAHALANVGGTVVLEPLSRGLNGDYPIVTIADALAVIRRAREASGSDNIALLFDTFHLANNGQELVSSIHEAGDFIGHVQFADTPGRGEPGTGVIDFRSVLDALVGVGYAKAIACEYIPSTATNESLTWIDELPHIKLTR